jgi:DNA mismatch endonuclease (patch repair protein)
MSIMTDPIRDAPPTVSPATRKVMQANKRRDTGPELKVRRWLHARGFRFRVDKGGLPGRPDVALPKHRVALFVHGCYWHGHDCGKGSKPKTNAAFWTEKFARNAARHERDAERLQELGWRVVVVWECDLKDMDRAMAPVMALLRPQEGQEGIPVLPDEPSGARLWKAVLGLLARVRNSVLGRGQSQKENPRE